MANAYRNYPEREFVSWIMDNGRFTKCQKIGFGESRRVFVKMFCRRTAVVCAAKILLLRSFALLGELRGWALAVAANLPVARILGYHVEGGWRSTGVGFIMMEYLEEYKCAWDAAQALASTKGASCDQLTSTLTLRLFSQLGEIHAAGLLHGDFHWGNIMVRRADETGYAVKLVDLSRMRKWTRAQDFLHEAGLFVAAASEPGTGVWLVPADLLGRGWST